MEYVTCGNTEFAVRELPEKLRVLNTVDPDSGDSLLVAEFKVRACARGCHAYACRRAFGRGVDVKSEKMRSPNDHEHAPCWINQVFEREGNGRYETISLMIMNINKSRGLNTHF